jgi:hypothetical protein
VTSSVRAIVVAGSVMLGEPMRKAKTRYSESCKFSSCPRFVSLTWLLQKGRGDIPVVSGRERG